MLAAGRASGELPISAGPAPAAARWHEVSLEEYRKHLQALAELVGACAKGRGAKACDPKQVGPDDRIPLAEGGKTEQRLVRFGWLRVLLSKAQDKDATEPAAKVAGMPASGARTQESALPPTPTTAELLLAAELRLTHDLAQAGAVPAAEPAHSQERETMRQVLAGREFRNLGQPSVRDAVLEKIGSWLNQFFAHAARLGARAAWLGSLIVWGFILAAGAGLAWGVMQFERKWRIRLTMESEAPAAGAASARDWQLWLEDARKAAAAGQWREAIHCVYWAVIARLETRRLWPADRARTPREYLALVAEEDPRKHGLRTLTRSFERTWYGGREAGESDYRRAEQLAEGLIAGSVPTRGGGAAQ